MSPQEFISKWRASTLNERASSHEHFIDLCHLLNEPTPVQADPAGAWYRFEKPGANDLLRRDWIDFFENAVRDLCDASGDFTRSTRESVIDSGQGRGAQVEKKVAGILSTRYGFNP